MEFNLDNKLTKKNLSNFADVLNELSDRIGFKVSARGWAYIMEQEGYVTKAQFDKIENAVNRCRREGFLPVDFVASEDARAFSGVIKPSEGTVLDTIIWMLEDVINGAKYFKPDWWEDEEYYIQILVEKVDLKTLFEPVCKQYKIPIANSKGWSSILQRAEYSKRFKEAEENGLKCVLLYCGDHDPDGLRISETIRNNLEQIEDVEWEDGSTGYDPKDLIIDRFGLNYDFIEENGMTWIDNLITGSKKNLADPNHRNYNLPYLKKYLRDIGERKCEANAIVTNPEQAKSLIKEAIEKYLGSDASNRFWKKQLSVKKDYKEELKNLNIKGPIEKIINDFK